MRSGKKGHFPVDMHMALIEQVKERALAGVVLLGDGDDTRWQHAVQDADWGYMCRSGNTMTASREGEISCLDTVSSCN